MSTLADRFLDNACPDHHVRGRQDHRRAESTAMRLLAQFPEVASANLATAIVCGDIEAVRSAIAQNPDAASAPIGEAITPRGESGRANDLYRDWGPKGWTPLLYLAFTRLPLPASRDNAMAIARLLLDAGADPNTYFQAGGSRYTPMTGVAGEGEEDRPPHPHRDALTELFLDYGANPYDIQVVYNLGFHSEYDWWLPRIYAHSVRGGHAADWSDPLWSMLGMGGYGSGARWFLEHAIQHRRTELAAWCLTHGASANAPPADRTPFSRQSLLDCALSTGNDAIAALLEQHGATRSEATITPIDALTIAALRLDAAQVRALLTQHPALIDEPKPLFRAAEQNRADAIELLIDAGFSPNLADEKNTRALNYAAWSGNLRATETLLRLGAEIDAVEQNYGGTAFGNAAHFLRTAVMDFLAARSRDVWNLVYNGYVDRLRVVLAEDPTRAQVDWDTWSPLLWLPPYDEDLALTIAQILVAYGADPHRSDSRGASPAGRADALAMPRLAAWLRGASKDLGDDTRVR